MKRGIANLAAAMRTTACLALIFSFINLVYTVYEFPKLAAAEPTFAPITLALFGIFIVVGLYALVRLLVASSLYKQYAPICDRIMLLEKQMNANSASSNEISPIMKVSGVNCSAIKEFEDFRVQLVIYLR